MIFRVLCVLVLALLTVTNADAQTVRFDTNVGTFDMVMNPMEIDGLQDYVDNLMAYIDSGRYDKVVVNRAADAFVLQMGGFQATTLKRPESFASLTPVPSFPNLIQDTSGDNIVDIVDPVANELSNTRSFVAMALTSNGASQVNSGTREFFVNVAEDNSFLDATGAPGGFVPFAQVKSMATIDLIMSLPQMATDDGDARSSDMPIVGNDRLVIIEKAYRIEDSFVGPVLPSAEATSTTSESIVTTVAAVSSPIMQIPEPPALVLILGVLVFLAVLAPRQVL